MVAYRVQRRTITVEGVQYNPGDLIPGDVLPRPLRFIKLGWVKEEHGEPEVDAGTPAGETTPTVAVEPEPEPESEKPVKKKRGRPRKKKADD